MLFRSHGHAPVGGCFGDEIYSGGLFEQLRFKKNVIPNRAIGGVRFSSEAGESYGPKRAAQSNISRLADGRQD